jgi:cell division protein FtsB
MTFRHIKILPILLIALILFIQYRLWFDHGGIVAMQQLKKQLASQSTENEQLKQRNDNLVLQVQNLQSNQDAIESRARQELGMIKKGETFYQLVDKP